MGSATYIVTGGGGFIGANLVSELMRRDPGCDILVVDDFRSGSFANIVEACERAGVGPFTGEVITESVGELNWQPAIVGLEPRAVFHLAAITDTTVADERTMIRDNTEGFGDMIDAAAEAGVPLVYASSAATYGTPAHARRREPFPLSAAGSPNNVYGFSKWLMEQEHRRAAARFAEPGGKQAPARRPHIVGLRYFNVFGPGEARKGKMASMCYQLAMQVLQGRRPRLFRDGTQARDQITVEDVVDCTIAAAGLDGRKIAAGVYNLGSGTTVAFNDIVAAIRDALDLPNLDIEYFDMPDSIRRFYQDFTCADMTETERGLGWKPAHDPLDAMRRYVVYLAERPEIRGETT